MLKPIYNIHIPRKEFNYMASPNSAYNWLEENDIPVEGNIQPIRNELFHTPRRILRQFRT